MANSRKTLARRLIVEVARRQLGASPGDVSPLRTLGSGLTRTAYRASIRSVDGEERRWVVLMPHPDREGNERTRREFALLAKLADEDLPFRVPRPIEHIEAFGGEGYVLTWCPGQPLDPWQRHTAGMDGLRTTALIAAAVHTLDPDRLPLPTRGWPTRRDHAQAELRDLVNLSDPVADEALAWCRKHLPPPDEPATMLHGDLLGQNILVTKDGPVSVVDWEYATRGDPASDLAIVSRSDVRIFGTVDGMLELVEAYHEAGGIEVLSHEVRVYELCMVAFQALEEIREDPSSRRREVARLRRALRRARQAED